MLRTTGKPFNIEAIWSDRYVCPEFFKLVVA